MRCPFCSDHQTQVVETRLSDDGDAIRRRRRCQACNKRFTTYERVELVMPAVVKKDGSRVEFDTDKIAASISLALRKRPVSTQKVADAIAEIVDQVRATGSREVSTERIGGLVMEALRNLDNVAYIRFASVYRSFEDIDQFTAAIREVGPHQE
tara:strand:+ start:179 stop:637 length:459 start_codon:yes stop_codon:yes gene_type:complete